MSAELKTGRRHGKQERRERILAELRGNPTVRISELARMFRVTTETVRRDIDGLSREGVVDRTYGGASVPALSREPSLDKRHALMVEERRRIADRAAETVEPGDVLMIDSGATTAHLVKALVIVARDVTVITNSLGHATLLGANPTARVVLCPGTLLPAEGGVYGPDTLDYLRRFTANKAFLGAGGLTVEGPTDVNSDVCWVKRAMIERSQHVTFVVDHTKLDNPGLELICRADRFDRLIIDRDPRPALVEALEQGGVEVVVA